MPTSLRHVLGAVLRDRLLQFLLLAGVILACFTSSPLRDYPRWIDWPTITTLLGLLLLTKSVEMSGYFDWLGRKMMARLSNERTLALFMVVASALLSTFLTNDVALFIVVPLTITLKKLSALPVTRLIIFEALAVNVGSLLTPIGNPQNILLWNHSGLSFSAFIGQMLPLSGVLLFLLLLFTLMFFPNKTIRPPAVRQDSPRKRGLLLACAVLYGVFLVSVDLGMPYLGLLIVLVALLCLSPKVILLVDWALIFIFMAMFIDVKLLTQLPALLPLTENMQHLSTFGTYTIGILLSQVISNVPATILLLGFIPATTTLAYAVNIGGFGFALGSMANLIALRMANEKRIWLTFHLFSITALVISAALGWWLI
ncbi:MAG: anion permease [Hafniaceae bacterium]|nr:anion permease [Hafniaceae bacterium]